jgi:O-antigen ligase
VAAPTLVPFAVAGVIGGLAVLVASLVAAAALVLPDPRRRAIATLAAPVVAVLALLPEVHRGALDKLQSHAAMAGAAAVAGLVALAALTFAFHRRPGTLALAAVAVLPFRVPVVVGGSNANLLLPLYGVIGAGCLAHSWRMLRQPGPDVPADRLPWARRLEWALAAIVVLYAAQSLYSDDVTAAAKNVCFFYVPFAILFRLLLDTPWAGRQLRWCVICTAVLSLVFAVVGFAEFATGRLLLNNAKVLEANELKPYFRVNSLFFDPNIYGRYLALTMVLLAAVLLWTRRRREVSVIGVTLAVLWAGLVLSLSQSSFGALLAGLAVLAALRWRTRLVAGIVAAAAAVGIALVLLAPGALHIEGGSSAAIDKATSGRLALVNGALSMFRDRPVLGYGSGGFQAVYRQREHVRSARIAAVSHTIPLTIAAEQGIVGLAAYLWLLVVTAVVLLGGLQAQLRRGPPEVRTIARAAVAAATAALIVHTLIYAAFLEDPILWTLLAIGAALRASVPSAPARAEPAVAVA